jgi:hypothetical protein
MVDALKLLLEKLLLMTRPQNVLLLRELSQASPFRRACVCVVVSAFVSEVEQHMLFLMFFSCCVIEAENILKKQLCTFGLIELVDNSSRHGCRRLGWLPWSASGIFGRTKGGGRVDS